MRRTRGDIGRFRLFARAALLDGWLVFLVGDGFAIGFVVDLLGFAAGLVSEEDGAGAAESCADWVNTDDVK